MTRNIMIVGVGGQGTLLTSRIIGKCAIASGYDVKISEVHGMAQRGGSVVTFVRFGDKVYEPVVEVGGADIVIAFEKLEAQRYRHYLKPDGILVVNDYKIEPMTVVTGAKEYPSGIIESLKEEHSVYSIDAEAVAKSLGNPKVLNSVMLGFAAQFIGLDKDTLVNTIEKTVPPRTVDINKSAFAMGYKEGR